MDTGRTATEASRDDGFEVSVGSGAQGSSAWEHCSTAGCNGAQTAAAEHCLAHLDPVSLDRYLRKLNLGHPLDARGTALTNDLLQKVFAACPADSVGRRRLRSPRFDQATFSGDVSFEKVSLERAASFDRATFAGSVSFADAAIRGSARFAQSCFVGPARFDGARFDGNAWFAGATFNDEAVFDNVRFAGMARFVGTRFVGDVRFAGAAFEADASFDKGAFECHGRFPAAVFEADASFEATTFANPGEFGWTTFKGKNGIPAVADVAQVAWSGPPLAAWGTRVVASLLDNGITAGIVAAGVLLGVALNAMAYNGGVKIGVVLGVLAAAAFAVRNLMEQGHTGQTFGKHRMGVRLIQARDRRAVGPLRSVVRHLLHAVDVAPLGAGLLWPLRDAKNQTFADKLTGTVVVIGRDLPVAAREASEAAAARSAGSG